MKNIVYDIALTFFLVLLFLALLLYIFQRSLIYIPDENRPSIAIAKKYGYQEVSYTTDDGLKLMAWYKKAKKGKPTIVYFHGNAGNITYILPIANYFITQGFGILLVEYRGYGGNPGHPSEQGLYQDGHSAIKFLLNQSVSTSNLVIYGQSLGSGVAVEMARDYQSCALILQSPFTSMYDVVHWHYPWIFFNPWDGYDSINKIGKINTPVLILNGKKDDVVPYQQGQTLFKAVRGQKKLVIYPDKGHNDLWQPDFYKQVELFIEHHCPGS